MVVDPDVPPVPPHIDKMTPKNTAKQKMHEFTETARQSVRDIGSKNGG